MKNINANINFKLDDYGTKITRSLMCCVLFAMSVVASFAANKLMIVGDAVWGGWTPEIVLLCCLMAKMCLRRLFI